jgi:SpoVK/Ycf46/Vps4 family AAA+-type ATPase
MASADLLLTLIRAGRRGDQATFRRAVEAIIAEERSKQHHVLAERIAAQLELSKAPSVNGATSGATSPPHVQNFIYEISPRRSLSDLILPDEVTSSCAEIIQEQHHSDLLRSYGLEPRNRVLLVGPPGNGKTTLAEALANALMVPMYVVRYDAIIGSYLGETASRLRKLFEYVCTTRCVLFFDEFDTLSKERGDVHETGEIKRVVSSLLLQVDAIPSYVVLITATNHPELLDKAVWRRFQLRLNLPSPSQAQIREWLGRFEERLGEKLKPGVTSIAQRLNGASFAEVEEFGLDILRRKVLQMSEANVQDIVSQRLAHWKARYQPNDKVGAE